MFTTSEKGFALVKKFEGLFLRKYFCPAGVLTIGYGHTAAPFPDEITEEQADDFLREDLRKCEIAVNILVKVDMSQSMFDALVSFTFNLGIGALGKSTLLKLLNEKNYIGASEQFPKWRMAGGKILKGLVRRRAAEQALFLSEGVPN